MMWCKWMRLASALVALFCCVNVAHAAGTVPGFNLTPQFDLNGHIAPGCRLFIIQAGTVSTPQIAYQDSSLTIPSPGGSTLTCDASGRLPQWFVADGSIKLRLTTSTGTQIFTQDGLLVVGASSGGGGGSPVDATTILATGDTKSRYGTGVLTGFVRLNGRTIGSATSGATERANSDAQALFEYLWSADTTLAVSTGRGASANADWVANKTLALPDARGRVLASLNDMGNTNAAVILGTTMTKGDTITLGSTLGVSDYALLATQIPSHTHSGNTGGESATHTHALPTFLQSSGASAATGGPGLSGTSVGGASTGPESAGHTHAFTTDGGTGGGQAHQIMQPTMLITTYIKL